LNGTDAVVTRGTPSEGKRVCSEGNVGIVVNEKQLVGLDLKVPNNLKSGISGMIHKRGGNSKRKIIGKGVKKRMGPLGLRGGCRVRAKEKTDKLMTDIVICPLVLLSRIPDAENSANGCICEFHGREKANLAKNTARTA